MMKIDARGLSCPEPLLMLKNGLNKNKEYEEVELVLSCQNALENCTRYAEGQGYKVTLEKDGEDYKLLMKKD